MALLFWVYVIITPGILENPDLYRIYTNSSFLVIVSSLYYCLLQSSKHQATYGMRMLGIKIYDEGFNRVGFWRLLGRHLSTGLSGMILYIGFFMIGWTKRKQGLHDIIARTVVVEENK